MKSLDKVMDRAISSYEMWHQKHPQEVLEVPVDWPPVVYQCGRAEQILYSSDKWEKDNDFYTYDHVFDTRPAVFCAPGSVLSQFSNSKKRSVSRLLGVSNLDKDPVCAPVLANTLELTISLSDGTGQTLKFNNKPTLCCTLDKKTLIICSKGDLLFISGGKMRVTERGIVK